MKQIIKLALLLICSISFSQTNFIDTSSWFEGTGSVSGFNREGTVADNIREIGVSPHGASVVLWKTIHTSGNSGAGGWTTDLIDIDHTKTYRFTVWLKKTNSFDGLTYYRARAKDASGNMAVNYLSGASNSNPYFKTTDPPTLDEWYLFVGYMHHSSYTNTSSIGGVYNGSTGVKMLDCTDYKFQSTATQIEQTIWLEANYNALDRQFYYGPTMYEVDGSEPSIQDLINAHPDAQIPSKPTLSTTAQTDTTIDLSWTAATDNIGVTGYEIYKDGVLEATLGNVLNYQVTGLTATTVHEFTVRASDASGNKSIDSNILNITTNSTPIPATNLLDTSTWTVGTGSAVGFNLYGTSTENSRELGTDPHGVQNVLWKTHPISASNDNNVGWATDYVNIDHAKTYRYTSWVKKTNSNDGTIYLSFTCVDDLGNNTGLNLDGSVNGAPYPYGGDPPHLDEWYLLVGYIHESGYSSTTDIGGLYDTNGAKQSNMEDFKFSNTATRFKLKNYLKFSTNINDEFFSYGPTLYEISGQEPSIEELINAQPNNIQTSTSTNTGYWSLNNEDVYYNGGRVGIGTDEPDEKLAVNGNIHTKEIRVDLNDWPDYVFTDKHQLPTLKEVENHIRENGHLKNIPSVKEVKEKGILLGHMNANLLEKIEELTLYTIQQQKELETQKDNNKILEERLIKLESLKTK
ncbi:MAG: fibronectin type III domain-containing protein [Algibacter sp.]